MYDDEREGDMSGDNIQLQDIMESYDITVKQLSMAVGKSASHCYRYLEGSATIPTIVWRWLYSKTRDIRILQLMTGEVPVVVVDIDTTQMGLDAVGLKNLLDLRKQQLSVEEHLINILDDGVVDAEDCQEVKQYVKELPKLMRTQYAIKEAILREYLNSIKAKAVQYGQG